MVGCGRFWVFQGWCLW